jgi:cytochrome P450
MTTDQPGAKLAGRGCPFDPGDYEDVLAYFGDLRAAEPVALQPNGTYAITKYDDLLAALNDTKTFSSLHELQESRVSSANVRSVIYCDDPKHLDLRRLINRAWTPRALLELLPAIETQASHLVASIRDGEPFDMVPLGIELAARVFAEVMGLPGQFERMRTWLASGLVFVRPQIAHTPWNDPAAISTDGLQAKFHEGYDDWSSYFREIISIHEDHAPEHCKDVERLTPFLRSLVAAVKADPANLDRIHHEIMPPLLAGGVSTQGHMYPSVVSGLLDRSTPWQMLKSDPSQLDYAGPSDVIEELIRLKGVVQGLPRVTTADVEVQGVTIPAGSSVNLWYLSGNHDADRFDDADAFHARGISRHLSFGFGTHSCIGQSLVRLVIKCLLRQIVSRFSWLESVPDQQTKWGALGEYYTPSALLVVAHV